MFNKMKDFTSLKNGSNNLVSATLFDVYTGVLKNKRLQLLLTNASMKYCRRKFLKLKCTQCCRFTALLAEEM
jgi:hypothetical protein